MTKPNETRHLRRSHVGGAATLTVVEVFPEFERAPQHVDHEDDQAEPGGPQVAPGPGDPGFDSVKEPGEETSHDTVSQKLIFTRNQLTLSKQRSEYLIHNRLKKPIICSKCDSDNFVSCQFVGLTEYAKFRRRTFPCDSALRLYSR